MKVIVGIGVPGCGKTTYLKPLAEELNLAYINPDDIRLELTGDPSNHTQKPAVWSLVHARFIEAIKNNGVIVDATYTRKRDRRELIELAKKNGAKEIIAYWFNPPKSTCLERNASRKRVVPEPAILKMYNRLQLNPPVLSEGFNRIVEIGE